MRTLVGLLALGFLCLYQMPVRAQQETHAGTVTCMARTKANYYTCHADRLPYYGEIGWSADPATGGIVWASSLMPWEGPGPCPGECIPDDDEYSLYKCGFINEGPDYTPGAPNGGVRARDENVFAHFLEMGITDGGSARCYSKSIVQAADLAVQWANWEQWEFDVMYYYALVTGGQGGYIPMDCYFYGTPFTCIDLAPYDAYGLTMYLNGWESSLTWGSW